MGTWNLKDFKIFCLGKGNMKAWRYAEALAFKWNAVKYFENNIRLKMSEIKSSLDKATLYDYEIDALMTNLNSIWDIMAQLINECLIKPKKDPNQVSFENITDYDLEGIPTLQKIVIPIKGNALYDIIKTFSNMSKHQFITKGVVNIDYREKPTNYSYYIQYENKKGKSNDLKLEKAIKCINFVGTSVDKIGAEIHKSLKSKLTP